jgi:hypothetical protein
VLPASTRLLRAGLTNRNDRDEAQQRPHDAKDWSTVAVLVDQTTLPTADEPPEPLRLLPGLPAGAPPPQRSSRISGKNCPEGRPLTL